MFFMLEIMEQQTEPSRPVVPLSPQQLFIFILFAYWFRRVPYRYLHQLGRCSIFLELMLGFRIFANCSFFCQKWIEPLLFLGQEHRERSVRPHLLCEPGSVSERGPGCQPQVRVPVFIVRDFCEQSGLENRIQSSYSIRILLFQSHFNFEKRFFSTSSELVFLLTFSYFLSREEHPAV